MTSLGKTTLIETPKIDKGTYIFKHENTGEPKEGQFGESIMLKYRAIKVMGDDGLEDLDFQPDHYEFFNLRPKYTKGGKEFSIMAAHLGREPIEGEELDDSIFTDNPYIRGTIDHVKNKQTGKISAKIVSWSKFGKYVSPLPGSEMSGHRVNQKEEVSELLQAYPNLKKPKAPDLFEEDGAA